MAMPIHPNDAEAMCRLYGASPETITTMRDLARETKSRGWYHSYDHAIKEWFKLYVGLEAAASTVRRLPPADHALAVAIEVYAAAPCAVEQGGAVIAVDAVVLLAGGFRLGAKDDLVSGLGCRAIALSEQGAGGSSRRTGAVLPASARACRRDGTR